MFLNSCVCPFLTFLVILLLIGTSIGFKNIASKIAYELRLWLDASQQHQQTSGNTLDTKSLKLSSEAKNTKHKRKLSADNSDTIAPPTTATKLLSKSSDHKSDLKSIKNQDSLDVEGSGDDTKVTTKHLTSNDLEGDENADEIELRVDEIKTPKETSSSGDAAEGQTKAPEASSEAVTSSSTTTTSKKFFLKTNSKDKEDKKKKSPNKGKTKSNTELSTAPNTASAAEQTQNTAKKSSSNRSINRNNNNVNNNNSGGGSSNKPGYNIFNFLFHSPTTEK